MKVPTFFKNRYVLYITVILGITNLLGYIAIENYDSMALLVVMFLLTFSCAPRYVERPPAPDSLFDAINIQDNKRPKKDKQIWKVLVFSTVSFMVYTMIEHNNIGYKPNGWNGR